MCTFKSRVCMCYRDEQSHTKPYASSLIENGLIGRFGKEKIHINCHLLSGPDICLDLAWKQVSFFFYIVSTPHLQE